MGRKFHTGRGFSENGSIESRFFIFIIVEYRNRRQGGGVLQKRSRSPGARAYLKLAFWQMYVTICGIFAPKEGRIT